MRLPGSAQVAGVGFALAAAMLAGCGPGEPPAPVTSPQRIVAVAPNVTEILFALGLGDRVAGVGDYASWPPEAAGKPRIGGLYDVRLERIVALDPDLAVVLPSEEALAEQLGRLGIELLTVPSESLEDVETAIAAIARRTGAEEEGRALIALWRRQLAPDRLSGRHRVALTVARERGRMGDVLVAGPDTFLQELLSRLGAENAFADAPLRYPQVGLEAFLERQPTAIVELQPEPLSAAQADELKRDWLAVPGLEAVDRGCIAVISGEHTLLPGPRLARLYDELREALSSCSSQAES